MVCRLDWLPAKCEYGDVQMNPINLITDGYERKARLYPALLLVAPLVITVVGVTSVKLSKLESLGAALVGCGGAFLLTQLARDGGKRCEKTFFEKWGGLPSVAVFRYRDIRIDPITKVRYHKKLSTLVKGTKAPSPEEEAVDPPKADQVYAAWSSYLRINTRDVKRFPLVFNENVNYGYRRNVCGFRRVGIIVSALSSIVNAVWLYHQHSVMGKVSEEAIIALVCTSVILLFWIFRFSSGWVRVAADAYAERLAETVDFMSNGSTSSKAHTRKETV
jgi:hypothetical protein